MAPLESLDTVSYPIRIP